MNQRINLGYMDIMCDGDNAMKQIMLEMLIAELPQELEQQQEAFQTNDIEQLSSISHKLKSTLSFVGYEAMTEANKEIELIARKQGDIARLPLLINNMQTFFADVMPELKAELNILQ